MDLIMRYLIALLFCFSLAAQQTVNNFTVKTNLVAQVINNVQVNPESFGAIGNGSTDNTSAIQAAINKAASIGAEVVFPAGTFISGPLTIPQGVAGIRGSEPYAEKYPSEAQCVLKLKANSVSSTLITIQSGSTAYLKNLVVDGNKTNQTASDPLVVIQPAQVGKRDEILIGNVGIYGSKGWGIKIQREEVELNTVQVIFCDLGGIWLSGSTASDCTFVYVGSGHHGGDGWFFDGAGSSAARIVNSDSYFNRGNGMVLNNVGMITATQLTLNNNFKHSLLITNPFTAINISQATIFGANWDVEPVSGLTNSAASGTYSDVYLDASAGSYSDGLNITASRVGLVLGASSSSKKPKYGIEDARSGGFSNGKTLSIIGNLYSLEQTNYFTSGKWLSTNIYTSGVLFGNVDNQGNQFGIVSSGNAAQNFAGQEIIVGPTTSLGFTNTSKLYNYQDGGFAFEIGPVGSKKYITFSSSGVSTFPDLISLKDFVIGPVSAYGYSSTVKFYQHQDGGLALEYGPTGSKKYVTFDKTGPVAFPSTFTSEGAITTKDSLTIGPVSAYGWTNTTKLFQHQDGGIGFEYGPNGSKKYSKFNSSGSFQVDGGDIIAGVAGLGLSVKEGSNAKMGVATLVAGTATVSTTKAGSGSRIFLTSQVDGGTPGWLRVSTRTAGTSFTITSSSATDTSTVAWIIFDPAP